MSQGGEQDEGPRDKAGRGRPGRDTAGPGRTGPAKAGPDKTSFDKMGRGKAGRGKASAAPAGPKHGKRHGASSGHDEGGAGSSHRTPIRRGGAKGPTQRQLRVGEEVRHVLAGVFSRAEFRDPELAEAQVTVTEVRLSPDLKHATAFVARLGRSDIEALLPSLKRVAPYLRTQVAHALRLRVAPDISFQPDTALEYAMYVDALLHRPEVARDLGGEAPVEDGSG